MGWFSNLFGGNSTATPTHTSSGSSQPNSPQSQTYNEASNAINNLKNKTSITANELKRLALYKTNPANVNAITNQALQSKGVGAMFKDGQLVSTTGKAPLDSSVLQSAQKVMAQALKDYATALRQTGGDQSTALAIAIGGFPTPDPKKEKPELNNGTTKKVNSSLPAKSKIKTQQIR